MDQLRHFGIKTKHPKRDKYSYSKESVCKDCGTPMNLPEYALGDPIHSSCSKCHQKLLKKYPRPPFPRSMMPGQGA